MREKFGVQQGTAFLILLILLFFPSIFDSQDYFNLRSKRQKEMLGIMTCLLIMFSSVEVPSTNKIREL